MIVIVVVFAVHHGVDLLMDIPYPVFGPLVDSASHRAMAFVPLLAGSIAYTGFAHVTLYLGTIIHGDGWDAITHRTE